MTVVAESTESTELRQGALSLGFIIFFVISAAGPLVAIAGGFPIGIMLGNGAGTPALLIATVVILLVFSGRLYRDGPPYHQCGRLLCVHRAGPRRLRRGRLSHARAARLQHDADRPLWHVRSGRIGIAEQRASESNMPWWVWSFVALASIAVLGYRQIDLSAKVSERAGVR